MNNQTKTSMSSTAFSPSKRTLWAVTTILCKLKKIQENYSSGSSNYSKIPLYQYHLIMSQNKINFVYKYRQTLSLIRNSDNAPSNKFIIHNQVFNWSDRATAHHSLPNHYFDCLQFRDIPLNRFYHDWISQTNNIFIRIHSLIPLVLGPLFFEE